MKVYTKIVYDKDDNIIEEHSYDYNGPVSHTKKSWEKLIKSDKYKKHKAKIEEMKKNSVGDGNTKTNGKDAKAEKAELKNANFKAEDNKLHKYASYSYQWTLSSLSQDNIDNWNSNIDTLGQNIIARSAGIGGKDNVVDRRKSGKYGMEAGTGSANIAEVLAARDRRKEDV